MPTEGRLKARALSIAASQVASVAGTLIFVLLLPDRHLATVVGLMAMAGFISGTAVSNNTAKIYATINAAVGLGHLSRMTFLLFCFEQAAALAIVCALILGREYWPIEIAPAELALLAIASSSGAVIAFVKFDDVKFIWFNIVRVISAAGRVGAVFAAIEYGQTSLLPEIIAASFALPTLYCIFFNVSSWRRERNATSSDLSIRPFRLLREYVWGVPVAISRAFVNQGLIVAAVELLTASELRLFRFLLLPKEGLTKLFNAALPLVFDRLYEYRSNTSRLVLLGSIAAFAASVWYAIGHILFDAGWGALATFIVYMALYLVIFSLLPIIWRSIYREKAILNAVVALLSSGVLAMALAVIRPQSVFELFAAMSIFNLCYIIGALLIARGEPKRADR